MNRREEWIDLTKAIAIILVVFGHVFDSFSAANIYPSYNRYLDYIHFTIYSFHMPLFFMISGYLYNKTEDISNFKEYGKLVYKKIINLGIPYVVFSILQGGIQVILSAYTHNKIGLSRLIQIYINPILQFWFLYVLILIFIFIPLMDLLIKNKYVTFGLLLILKFIFIYKSTGYVVIDSLAANCIYFYMGICVSKVIPKLLKDNLILKLSSSLYVVINLCFYFGLKEVSLSRFTKGSVDIILAILGSLLVIYITKVITNYNLKIRKVLNIVGLYSFEIYLLHILFSYGTKTLLNKVGISNFYIHTVLGVLMGVIIPIIVGYISKKVKYINYLFYPGIKIS